MKATRNEGLVHRMGHALCWTAWAAMVSVAAQTIEPNGPPPEPPPEALAACKSLTSGKDCSVKTPDGTTIKGTCWAPQGKALACKPKDAPTGLPPPPKQQK